MRPPRDGHCRRTRRRPIIRNRDPTNRRSRRPPHYPRRRLPALPRPGLRRPSSALRRVGAHHVPLRGHGRRPSRLRAQAGYYGIDTTPLTPGAWDPALGSASAALAGAAALLTGDSSAYALCRPPGHHAGRDYFGGYCYLNNAALAAIHLASQGRVALIDIDYHHGNGTQDIFYASADVLFISLHADPAYQYPLYWGYADERGEDEGEDLTRNFPLPPGTDDAAYLAALDAGLTLIADFDPSYLIVSAGLDIYRGDPLGDWEITQEGLQQIGARIAAMALPTLLVQEGGYDLDDLGANVRRLLAGFIDS